MEETRRELFQRIKVVMQEKNLSAAKACAEVGGEHPMTAQQFYSYLSQERRKAKPQPKQTSMSIPFSPKKREEAEEENLNISGPPVKLAKFLKSLSQEFGGTA